MRIQQIGKFRQALATLLLCGVTVAVAHEFPLRQRSDVSAYGHDPVEWQLEIAGASGTLTLTLEGVSESYQLPALGPSQYKDELKVLYRVPNDRHALTVFVKGESCIDSVSGKLHEVTVIIARDGKGYAGCGDVLNR